MATSAEEMTTTMIPSTIMGNRGGKDVRNQYKEWKDNSRITMTDDMPTVNGGGDNDDDDGNAAHGNIAPPTITTMTGMHLWQ